MQKLAAHNRDKVIDILAERLAFERGNVRLYDTILAKLEPLEGDAMRQWRKDLLNVRNQEKEHEEWLEEQIRKLGGTAHERTERSDLVERESQGIAEVVQSDKEIPHLFHALLTAELVDNAGWALLIELAEAVDDDLARREFTKRFDDEEEHLALVRNAVKLFTQDDVLGSNLAHP